MVWDIQCLEDIFTKDDSVSDLIYGKGVCRTVPATPGLLIIIIDRILARLSENPKSSFRLRRWKSSKLIKLWLVLCENTLQRRSVTK